MDPSVKIALISAVFGLLSLIVTLILAPALIRRSVDKSLAASKAAEAKVALETRAAEREQDRRDKEADRARQQRDKDEERARQDRIAAQVQATVRQTEETARLLAADKSETARLLVESNARNAEERAALAKVTNEKLDSIKSTAEITHGIVNSGATANKQVTYDTLVASLALMRRLAEFEGRSGIEPSPQSLADFKAIEDKIAALRVDLDLLQKQALMAEKQAKTALLVAEEKHAERSDKA